MHIAVDLRERNSKLPQELEKLGMKVHWKHLTVGDYAFGSLIGIERKTPTDLQSSLKDGRLRRQRQALKASYTHGLLMVIGEYWDGLGTRDATAMASCITEDLGVVHVQTDQEAALIIHAVCKRLDKNKLGQTPDHVPVLSKKPRDPQKQAIYVVASLPGVGPGRARALVDHFGSLAHLFAADWSEIEKTPGVGRVTAKRLHALFQTQHLETNEKA